MYPFNHPFANQPNNNSSNNNINNFSTHNNFFPNNNSINQSNSLTNQNASSFGNFESKNQNFHLQSQFQNYPTQQPLQPQPPLLQNSYQQQLRENSLYTSSNYISPPSFSSQHQHLLPHNNSLPNFNFKQPQQQQQSNVNISSNVSKSNSSQPYFSTNQPLVFLQPNQQKQSFSPQQQSYQYQAPQSQQNQISRFQGPIQQQISKTQEPLFKNNLVSQQQTQQMQISINPQQHAGIYSQPHQSKQQQQNRNQPIILGNFQQPTKQQDVDYFNKSSKSQQQSFSNFQNPLEILSSKSPFFSNSSFPVTTSTSAQSRPSSGTEVKTIPFQPTLFRNNQQTKPKQQLSQQQTVKILEQNKPEQARKQNQQQRLEVQNNLSSQPISLKTNNQKGSVDCSQHHNINLNPQPQLQQQQHQNLQKQQEKNIQQNQLNNSFPVFSTSPLLPLQSSTPPVPSTIDKTYLSNNISCSNDNMSMSTSKEILDQNPNKFLTSSFKNISLSEQEKKLHQLSSQSSSQLPQTQPTNQEQQEVGAFSQKAQEHVTTQLKQQPLTQQPSQHSTPHQLQSPPTPKHQDHKPKQLNSEKQTLMELANQQMNKKPNSQAREESEDDDDDDDDDDEEEEENEENEDDDNDYTTEDESEENEEKRENEEEEDEDEEEVSSDSSNYDLENQGYFNDGAASKAMADANHRTHKNQVNIIKQTVSKNSNKQLNKQSIVLNKQHKQHQRFSKNYQSKKQNQQQKQKQENPKKQEKPSYFNNTTSFNLPTDLNKPVDLMKEMNVASFAGNELTIPPLHENHHQQITCDPEIMSSTLNVIPNSSSNLSKSRLPFGIIIHPLKDYPTIPVIKSGLIVRCRLCRMYINCYVNLVERHRWKCNMCSRFNDLPDDYLYDPQSHSYTNGEHRPEMTSASYELIAPPEYSLRSLQAPKYVFLFDVSFNAIETGYLHQVCNSLMENLSNITTHSETSICIMSFDSQIHYYNLHPSLIQPVVYRIVDLDDPEPPIPLNSSSGILTNIKQSEQLIIQLLKKFPYMHQGTQDTHSAMGSAIKAAFKLLDKCGGKITVFQSKLPDYGEGRLTMRENVGMRIGETVSALSPSSDFYKLLALECSQKQVAVDLVAFGSQYSDLCTLSTLSRYSAGNLYYFPSYHLETNKVESARMESFLERYFTRNTGSEAVFRVRLSRGLGIQAFHGPGFVRSTDLLSLSSLNSDSSFGVQLLIEDQIDEPYVCIQSALLYTTNKAERRIRIHTLFLPVSCFMSDIFNYANQLAITSLVAKMAVDKALMNSTKCSRDAISIVSSDILSSFTNEGSSFSQGNFGGRLSLPYMLRCIPLFMLALTKSVAFRLGVNTKVDERVNMMEELKSIPLLLTIQLIYPSLYPLHILYEKNVFEFEYRDIYLPPALPLSASSLERKGAYLLDDGVIMYIWVFPNTNPTFISDVFGVNQYQDLTEGYLELPEHNNDLSENLRGLLDYHNNCRPFTSPTVLIKDDSKNRLMYYEKLLEDRTNDLIKKSYTEYLKHLSHLMTYN